MLVFLHFKSTGDQFRPNGRQFRRGDDNVCVCRKHRSDIAIDGQTANEAPVTMAIQNLNQEREIAAAPVGDRFEYFSCSHFGGALQIYSLSNIPAAPMPPPTHIVTMP